MPKPNDAISLISASNVNFQHLFEYIENMNEYDQEKIFPQGTMNRNIRDVLAHVYAWQLMMISWYQIGLENKKPVLPAQGYTWRTVPQLNKKIWSEYQNTSLKNIKSALIQSHKVIMKLIENHTNDELFEKKRYAWTGSTTLGAYFTSATSSHYSWALTLIKKACKNIGD